MIDSTLYSQPEHCPIPDSLKKYKPKFVLAIGTHQSFVRKYPSDILGIKFGVQYNNHSRVGIGFYHLLTRIIVSPAREQGAKIASGLDYFGLYYAYAIYNKKRNVEIGFPIQACFGFIHRERLVPGQMPERLKDAPVSLVETSVTAYLRIYRWLGIGGEAGYRFTIDPVDNIRNNLNSPIWHLGLKINLSYLYKDVFH